MKTNKQHGFTLVEIAIVLVIIGLLLGGILKGQELINSARVRNLADQNSGVQAAYYGFIDRYRQVPGDWSAGAATIAIGQTIKSGGDGNGRIDKDSLSEAGAVWEQLAKAGFIAGNYQGDTSTVEEYRNNSPRNAFNGAVLLAPITDYKSPATTGVTKTTSPERLVFIFGAQIPVSIMRELDVKLDDSKPDTGILRFVDAGSSTTGIKLLYKTAGACVKNDKEWNIEGAEQNCSGAYLY